MAADTVSTNVIFSSSERRIIHILNTSGGDGESAVVKIDKSALTDMQGGEPSALSVMSIEGNVDGMKVDLYFDRTSDIKVATLTQGYNKLDWSKTGGFKDAGTGDTGDLILTTTGHTSGDSYSLTIDVRLIV